MVSTPPVVSEPSESSYPIDKLAFQRHGVDGNPPLLVLHGWGSSAHLMTGLSVSLGQYFDVFSVDLPGHGQSPAPLQSMDIPDHARLIADFIETHIGKSVIVVGHSNGGRISLFMAAQPEYSSLFSKLILISPSGIKPKRGLSYYTKVWTAKFLKAPFVKLPDPMRSAGLHWVRGTFVWRMLGSSDYMAATGIMREVFIKTVNFFVDDMIENIVQPVLLLWGTNDSAISRYQVERLIQGIDDIKLVELDGASHYGFLDEPEVSIASINDFLAVNA